MMYECLLLMLLEVEFTKHELYSSFASNLSFLSYMMGAMASDSSAGVELHHGHVRASSDGQLGH